jgi:hypothetical protein
MLEPQVNPLGKDSVARHYHLCLCPNPPDSHQVVAFSIYFFLEASFILNKIKKVYFCFFDE